MRVSKHRTALLAITMLLALGAFAPAAVAGDVYYDDADGGTLAYDSTGDSAAVNRVVIISYDPNTGRDHVVGSGGIDSVTGNGCQYENGNPSEVSCPGSVSVQVDLGAGRDEVSFSEGAPAAGGECFDSYVLNFGEGDNAGNDLNDSCSTDATLVVTAGSGPDQLQGGSASTTSIISAGAGDDTVNRATSGGAGDDFIYGGAGDDDLWGYGGNDQIYGEGGGDQLLGGAGNDIEDGGVGNDFIGFTAINTNGENDTGRDTYRGGSGYDRLHFDGHVGGMAISPDGQANDGSPGEGDNVGSDFELILGTSATDVFRGSPGPDYFDGGAAGRDDIRGGGGDDTLIGGGGDNFLYGDAGNDQIEGRYGIDRVEGGSGSDRLFGDIDGCVNSCDPDPGDSLFAVDGESDLVNCGGAGKAQIDQFDRTSGRGCNSIDRRNVAAGGGGATLAKASFRGSKRSIKVSRSGRFTYSFRTGASLRGKASFRSIKKVRVSKRGRVTLATKSFKAPKSGKVKLKIKLSRKKLRILRRNRKIKTKVTVTLKNAAGLSSVASATVTLKR